jgi:hypothetical protein
MVSQVKGFAESFITGNMGFPTMFPWPVGNRCTTAPEAAQSVTASGISMDHENKPVGIESRATVVNPEGKCCSKTSVGCESHWGLRKDTPNFGIGIRCQSHHSARPSVHCRSIAIHNQLARISEVIIVDTQSKYCGRKRQYND